MEKFTITELNTLQTPQIVAVGVGDSGKNIIDYMANQNTLGIELIIANTGEQDYYESLRETLEGADVVFIVTGLGGISSTAIAPLIAKLANEVGALTIGIVSKPFSFEGRKCLKLAEEGLRTLNSECNSVVVLSNDKLLSIIDPKLGIKDSFKIIDSIFARVINGISGVIIPSGENDINLDLTDLKTIMIHRGVAIVGIGEYQGENAAYKAMNAAMKFATVDGLSMKNASGILVHFNMHPEFHFMQLSAAMEVVHKSIDESAEVIFGTTTDDSFPLDFIRVTIIATGIEKIPMMAANNVY